MALTKSSRGDKPVGIGWILLGIALFAWIIAMGANSGEIVVPNDRPSPSVTR